MKKLLNTLDIASGLSPELTQSLAVAGAVADKGVATSVKNVLTHC